MKISKRTANAIRRGMMLRKYTYAGIARECGYEHREVVRQWVLNLSIPDSHIQKVASITGVTIK